MTTLSAAALETGRSTPITQGAWIRLAGWAGLTTFALFIVGLGFQFAAGPPPDFADAAKLTNYVHNNAVLLTMGGLILGAALVIELVFVVGIRDLIRSIGSIWTSIGDLFLAAYVVAYGVGLSATGLLIGAATEAGISDTAATRTLWGAGFSLLGAVSYLPLILATLTFAVAVRRTRVLPQWTARIAWLVVIGDSASVPAAFGGTGFYSQLGPAPLLLGLLPGLVWVLVVSISMVRFESRSEGR